MAEDNLRTKLILLTQGEKVAVKSTTHGIGETIGYVEPDTIIEVYTIVVGEFYELADGSIFGTLLLMEGQSISLAYYYYYYYPSTISSDSDR